MATLQFLPRVPSEADSVLTASLGVNAAGKFTDKELGKAVKAGSGVSNYVLCDDGDDIEGIVLAVDPNTINDGFGQGTVQCRERVVAVNKGGGSIARGAQVIAAAQVAVGTAITEISSGLATGYKPCSVKAGTGTHFKWRVISLLGGAGAVDSPILIERI